jgi:hypothetical protein
VCSREHAASPCCCYARPRRLFSRKTAGQQERIAVFAMLLPDGNLFYALGVAPRNRFSEYDAAFRRVIESIEIIK